MARPAAAQGAAAPAPAPASPVRAVTLRAEPALVGAGVVSTALSEFAPSLTPDGRTMLYALTDGGFSRMTLMESRRVNGRWTTPTVLPFSGRWNDGDGALSPDGSRFIFISNRPATGDSAKADLDLWEVTRTHDGRWGTPELLPAAINTGVNEVYPSIANDGTLYFGRAGAELALFRVRRVGRSYGLPERLPFSGVSLAVSPDQRFAIFGAPARGRGGAPGSAPPNFDLHFVESRDGVWGAPARIEGPVNSSAADFASWITADGRSLYFVSARRGAPVPWPRDRAVRTGFDVRRELDAVIHNGLRNIYRVDLGEVLAGLPER